MAHGGGQRQPGAVDARERPVNSDVGMQVQTGNDPRKTRYGCFLPDLTGLARRSSAASLLGQYIAMAPGNGNCADSALRLILKG
jgi:hypothetical protein